MIHSPLCLPQLLLLLHQHGLTILSILHALVTIVIILKRFLIFIFDIAVVAPPAWTYYILQSACFNNNYYCSCSCFRSYIDVRCLLLNRLVHSPLCSLLQLFLFYIKLKAPCKTIFKYMSDQNKQEDIDISLKENSTHLRSSSAPLIAS